MEWVRKGGYWVSRGMDWIADGLRTITDPNWLMRNPGWAALLGLGVLLFVGWFFLFRGRRI